MENLKKKIDDLCYCSACGGDEYSAINIKEQLFKELETADKNKKEAIELISTLATIAAYSDGGESSGPLLQKIKELLK